MPPLFVLRRRALREPVEGRFALLHGILGRGSNLGALARRLQRERPGEEAWMLDLPGHGRSRPWPPPWRMEAVARAIEETLAPSGTAAAPLRWLAGHSFGGKSALRWLADTTHPPEHLFVLDANPGARPDRRGAEGLMHVLATLRRHTADRYPSRGAFEARMRAEGILPAVATWLATNLEPSEAGGLVFGLDLDLVDALLEDHFREDLWALCAHPPEPTVVHLVVGGRSRVLDAQDVARAEGLAARQPRLRVHHIRDAGHWLHVEALEPLTRILATAVRAPGSRPSRPSSP